MKLRLIVLCVSAALALVTGPTVAQVNLADRGESGVGAALGFGFGSEYKSLGLQVSGTAAGIVDLGLSMIREAPDGADSYWVKGVSGTFVPLRSKGDHVRVNLGVTAAYQLATINIPIYVPDISGGYHGVVTVDENVTTLGGLGFVDVDLNPRARLQFLLSYTKSRFGNLGLSVTSYTIGLGLITTPDSGARIGLQPTITIPSEGGEKSYGFQLDLFWVKDERY